ncbi:MAG: MarR family transcriptional regulator [Solobacterium sp.]|nr:MarR family transcriptional regulator [Solobacterium sp.]
MNDEFLKLENQLCFPLYASARKVVNLYTPLLKPLGITYTQYLVFLVLWESPRQTVGELCEKLHLDTGTLTPLLKKMETAGFITRARSSADERVVEIELSEKGKALKEQARDIPVKVGGCLCLEPDEVKALYSALHKILEMG